MVTTKVDEGSRARPRSRWLKRDATLLVFGIGGSLTGFVQLIPLIAPHASRSFIQGLSVGVFILTAVLLGVAFLGGRWAQARHVEMLRIRMIKKRRWLLRWERHFRGASETIGFLLAIPEEHRKSFCKLNATVLRRARFYRILLKALGNHFDYEWLRFQRVRNDYLGEIGRELLGVYETNGIVKLNTFNVEIGRQKGMQRLVSARFDDSTGLVAVSKAKIELLQSQRDADRFSSFLKTADDDIWNDDGTDPGMAFYKGVIEMFDSKDFWRQIKRM